MAPVKLLTIPSAVMNGSCSSPRTLSSSIEHDNTFWLIPLHGMAHYGY